MARDADRRAAVIALIATRTKANTSSPKVARDSLIREGIYTSSGKLRAEYGGGRLLESSTKTKK